MVGARFHAFALAALLMLVALAMPGSTEASFLTEAKKLAASDAQPDDKFGASVAVSGDTALVGASREDAGGSNAGAAYVLQRNVGGADNWGEVKKLTASEAEAGDFLGISVAVDADTAVVGAIFEDASGLDAGAAYVFQRNQGGTDNWGEVTKLTASDAEAGDRFGIVAVSAGTAVVGAFWEDADGSHHAGAAYIFQRNEGGADNWGEVTKLTASDAQAEDHFGGNVAVSGDTVIVAAPKENNAGAVYVFQRNQGGVDNWGEVKKLTASDAQAGDLFGRSVALNGDIAMVGANGEDAQGGSAGAAYIFGRDQGGQDNWGEVKKLTASDAQADDWFGTGAAVSGDTAVVGAENEDAGAFQGGAAYVFQRDQGGQDNWGEVAKLTASDVEAFDRFGTSLDVDGDIALVGTFGDNAPGNIGGAAYLFDLLGPKSTATPTPTFLPGHGAWSLRVEVSQQTGCPGGPVAGKVCVGLGQQFKIIVTADTSPTQSGLRNAQIWIDYDDQGLVHKKNSELLWDCPPSAFLVTQDVVNNGAYASCVFLLAPALPPYVTGDLYSFAMTCSGEASSSSIQSLPYGDPIAGTLGTFFFEWQGQKQYVPAVSGLQVSCVPCPPLGCQTPTPLPVGGVALGGGLRPGAALEPEPGGGRAGWLVAGSLTLALALAAAGTAAVVWKRR